MNHFQWNSSVVFSIVITLSASVTSIKFQNAAITPNKMPCPVSTSHPFPTKEVLGGGVCFVLEYENFIKIGFIFLEQFQVPAQQRGVQRSPVPQLLSHAHPQPSPPQPDGAFVTTGGPALTAHCHPRSGVHAALTLGAAHSAGLDKWIMTCIHHFGIT